MTATPLLSLVIFLLVRRSLIDPIRQVTREIERIAEAAPGSSPSLGLPEFESREMAGLASAVSRACAAKSR